MSEIETQKLIRIHRPEYILNKINERIHKFYRHNIRYFTNDKAYEFVKFCYENNRDKIIPYIFDVDVIDITDNIIFQSLMERKIKVVDFFLSTLGMVEMQRIFTWFLQKDQYYDWFRYELYVYITSRKIIPLFEQLINHMHTNALHEIKDLMQMFEIVDIRVDLNLLTRFSNKINAPFTFPTKAEDLQNEKIDMPEIIIERLVEEDKEDIQQYYRDNIYNFTKEEARDFIKYAYENYKSRIIHYISDTKINDVDNNIIYMSFQYHKYEVIDYLLSVLGMTEMQKIFTFFLKQRNLDKKVIYGLYIYMIARKIVPLYEEMIYRETIYEMEHLIKTFSIAGIKPDSSLSPIILTELGNDYLDVVKNIQRIIDEY